MRIVSDLNKYQRSSKNDRRTSCIRWKEGSDHSNLQAEISYLKAKLFGASSEKRRKEDLPGQMSLFDELMEEEPAKEIETGIYWDQSHERKRKKKPDFNEQFRDIPVRQEFVDTLTEEQKTCSICGTKMVEIGHELIRKY